MREMTNLSHEDAKKNGWNILVPLECEVVGKAVLEDPDRAIRVMKSTKRFKVPGGWVYNTSTEIHSTKGISVAEALTFVPA